MKYFIANDNLELTEVDQEEFEDKVYWTKFKYACGYVMLNKNSDIILLPTENVRQLTVDLPNLHPIKQSDL